MMEVETKQFGKAILTLNRYADGGQVAIELISPEHEPIARLTVNMPEVKLEPREIIVKGWGENEQIIEDCRASGYFFDTGKRIKTGFVTAEVWKIKLYQGKGGDRA